MDAADEYCDLCDLPKSQCIHGLPPAPKPEPKPAARPQARPTKKAAGSARTSRAVTRSVSRRWTPPEVFEPHILAVLAEAGGELEADEVFEQLEARLEDQLRPGDQETTPAGELRWRYAARRARQSLIKQGMMAKGGPGLWQLS